MAAIEVAAHSLRQQSRMQIGLMTEATAINLGRNALTSTIPSEIGQVSKINDGGSWGLLLSNQLTGLLPSQLGRLTLLTNRVGQGFRSPHHAHSLAPRPLTLTHAFASPHASQKARWASDIHTACCHAVHARRRNS